MKDDFKFALNAEVVLSANEKGTVIGRAEYVASERSYMVRYVAGDGRLVDQWWGESALQYA